MKKERIMQYLNRLCLGLALVGLCAGIYIASNGLGLIDGLDFGPGAYYYTDVPNWSEIFLGKDTINLGFSSLPLAVFFFIAWGTICFKAWQWLDGRLK